MHLIGFKKDILFLPEELKEVHNILKIKNKDIGYAGLKDKHAMTKQYISLHKKHEEDLENFNHENVKILSKTYHNNKIRIGHLRANRFFIKLKKVNPTSAQKIDEALKNLANDGMPNFFGYQRFGRDGDNHIVGEQIAKGEKKERNPKIKKLLINAYQSHLFNLWLSRRLEINKLVTNFEATQLEDLLNLPNHEISKMKAQKQPFKLISGDIMEHYPYGRLFDFEGEQKDFDRFNAKDISDNLKRQGGFIPGVRAGNSTKEFLNDIAGKLTLTGSIYLGLVATLPWIIVKGMGVPFFFGGTAVLIVVQVALDTMRKIEAQVYMSKYETLSAVGL